MSSVRRLAIVIGALSVAGCHVQLDRDRVADPTPIGARSSIRSDISASRALPWRVQSESVGGGTRRPADPSSASLPVLMVDLGGRQIGETEVAGVLKVIEDHDGSLKDLAARPIALQSRVSLEIHGESSTGLAKKSYQIELVSDRQGEGDRQLLGLPPGTDFVLHSCASDRTCLRNVLAYALGRELGRYAPRTRFVELFLDAEYRGVYVLVERIRRDDQRVDLPRPAGVATDGDITGGYIFKMDLGEGSPADPVLRDWVSPVSQTVYSYYYPRFNQITAAQKAYLHDHVSRFETMMAGRTWNSEEVGYRRWLDVPSWVDFALLQELSINPDAYFKSVYLQKWPESMGNRLALGPVWDFDLAFGVAEFRDARNTRAWAHQMNRFGTVRVPSYPGRQSPYVPVYWERLWTDPGFQRDLRCRWTHLRSGPLQASRVNGMIDRWAGELRDAQPRDAAVWGNPPANAYAGEVDALKDFLAKRLAWMDANLPGRCAA